MAEYYLPKYNLYLEPHAKYYWNDKFINKINILNNMGYNIIAFHENNKKDILEELFI